jgi:hypothetical protein
VSLLFILSFDYFRYLTKAFSLAANIGVDATDDPGCRFSHLITFDSLGVVPQNLQLQISVFGGFPLEVFLVFFLFFSFLRFWINN